MFPIHLTINGDPGDIALDDPRVTLPDPLRERFDLTGTRKGCDHGQCFAARSCSPTDRAGKFRRHAGSETATA